MGKEMSIKIQKANQGRILETKHNKVQNTVLYKVKDTYGKGFGNIYQDHIKSAIVQHKCGV